MSDEETTAAALAEIDKTLDDTVIAWSGATVYDMTSGNGIDFSISGPNVYIAFQAQQGSAGADVDGVTTSGWGHVHTIYRDPTNDYANSVTQQASAGMSGGPGAEHSPHPDARRPYPSSRHPSTASSTIAYTRRQRASDERRRHVQHDSPIPPLPPIADGDGDAEELPTREVDGEEVLDEDADDAQIDSAEADRAAVIGDDD